MLSKACLTELAAQNIFLLKIKPSEVRKKIENLIDQGSKILFRYKNFDPLLSKFKLMQVTSSDNIKIFIEEEQGDVLFYKIDTDMRRITVVVCPQINPIKINPKRDTIPRELKVPTDGCEAQKLENYILKKISDSRIDVFNKREYLDWCRKCEQTLDDIGRWKDHFSRAQRDVALIGLDTKLIEDLSSKINILETALQNISGSKTIAFKWIMLKNYIFNSVQWIFKKICGSWIGRITASLSVVLIGYWHKIWYMIQPYVFS